MKFRPSWDDDVERWMDMDGGFGFSFLEEIFIYCVAGRGLGEPIDDETPSRRRTAY